MFKKFFLLFILALLLLATYLSIINFEMKEIPSIVSFVGWIITIFFQLFDSLKSRVIIFFKGFVTDTVSSISIRISEIDDYSMFLEALRSGLYKSEKIKVIKFPINTDGRVGIETIKDNRSVNFVVSYFFDDNTHEGSVYIKFDKIQNRHSSVLEFSELIDSYIRFFEKVINSEISSIYFDLIVEYPKENNPLITEFINKKNVSLIAEGDGYKISNSRISVSSKAENLIEYTKKTLLGKLNY